MWPQFCLTYADVCSTYAIRRHTSKNFVHANNNVCQRTVTNWKRTETDGLTNFNVYRRMSTNAKYLHTVGVRRANSSMCKRYFNNMAIIDQCQTNISKQRTLLTDMWSCYDSWCSWDHMTVQYFLLENKVQQKCLLNLSWCNEMQILGFYNIPKKSLPSICMVKTFNRFSYFTLSRNVLFCHIERV